MAHDELIRIYTPDGKPTNHYKQRGEVHRDGDWHGTVHLWLMNSSRELLFQKRSNSTELHPGLWDVSAAGHIISDDSPELSLEREALEELGLRINATDAQYLFTLKTESHTKTLHERVFQFVYLLIQEVDELVFQPQDREVTAVQWRHCSLLEELSKDATGFVPRLNEYARVLEHLNRYT